VAPDLVDGTDAGWTWWDALPIVVEKVHYVLPKRRCGCCGKLTTATPPSGQAGALSYVTQRHAAAILVASQDYVPVEATAGLLAALLGTPVSTGFVAVRTSVSQTCSPRPASTRR
jgi:hypothetical protein